MNAKLPILFAGVLGACTPSDSADPSDDVLFEALLSTGITSEYDTGIEYEYATSVQGDGIFVGAQNGYSYETLFTPEGGGNYEQGISTIAAFSAQSAVLGATTVSPLPTSGTAIYSGSYRIIRVEDITDTGDGLTGTQIKTGGMINLAADFDTGRLQGRDVDLTVNGTFASETLRGSVVFRGISGTLDGLIGEDLAVGTFNGSTPDEVFAGGFLVISE